MSGQIFPTFLLTYPRGGSVLSSWTYYRSNSLYQTGEDEHCSQLDCNCITKLIMNLWILEHSQTAFSWSVENQSWSVRWDAYTFTIIIKIPVSDAITAVGLSSKVRWYIMWVSTLLWLHGGKFWTPVNDISFLFPMLSQAGNPGRDVVPPVAWIPWIVS